MVREFLGNIKGPKGDVGERGADGVKGDKGDTGELKQVNPNLIPMTLNDWVGDEHYSTATGEKQNYSGRSRLTKMIDVVKGQTYTISDDSLYVSAMNGLRWYIFDNGTFVESSAITRGQTKQIEMTGNQITFCIYPLSGTSSPHRFIENSDNRLVFKLEKGDEKTTHLNAFLDYDRKVASHESALTGFVDLGITAVDLTGALGFVNAHKISAYTNRANTETLLSDGVVLSKGIWHIDLNLRFNQLTDNTGSFHVLLNKNGTTISRAITSINDYNSCVQSITTSCNEGDKIEVLIFAFDIPVSQQDSELSLISSSGTNYITMKKVGEQ